MIHRIIPVFIISILFFSCERKRPVIHKETVVEPITQITSVLKTIDSKEIVKGECFINSFPQAKFERWIIPFAIGGIEFDIWRINDDLSLVLFPEVGPYVSPYEERPTGIKLEITDSLTSNPKVTKEYILELPTERYLEYFGSTARVEYVGLVPECLYHGFVLITEKENFVSDLDKGRVFTSSGCLTK